MKTRRSVIAEDIRVGRGLKKEEVEDCVVKLEKEWSELCDCAEIWQNKMDNALANMRMFEKDLENFADR